MKKLLVFTFVLFFGIIIFVAMMGLSLFNDWPSWTALALLGLIWGGPIVYFLGKNVLAWLANRRYAKALRSQEQTSIKAKGFSLLKQQWRHGLMALNANSIIRDTGRNRDLGWFLLLGPANSGKPEALLESGLINSLRAQGWESRDAQGGCDWYLFDNSVVLDVKGLVAEPTKSGDSAELAEFMELLSSSGRAKPLEGVALTIPAELLDLQREDDLKALATQDRAKLDALAQELDQSAPVYLVLTRLDILGVLADSLKLLEANNRSIGVLLDPENPPRAELVRQFLEAQSLNLFFEVINPEDPLSVAPILGSLEIFKDLERALTVFMTILSHEYPNVPVPKIRGVFFSTRADLDRPKSQTISSLANVAPLVNPIQTPQPQTSQIQASQAHRYHQPGLTRSLGDFFGRIMPANRALTERLNLPGGRRQKIIMTSLLVYYAVTFLLALAIRWEVGYNQQINQTFQAADAIVSPSLDGEEKLFESNFTRLDYIVKQFEIFERQSWYPRLWETQADLNVAKVRREFQFSFENANVRLLDTLSRQMGQNSTRLDYGVTLRQLLWLFEVYSSHEHGVPFDGLALTFPILPSDYHGPSASLWNLAYNKSLFEYLERFPHDQGAAIAFKEIQALIEKCVVDSIGHNFDWFVSWADTLPNVYPVSVASFWERFGIKIQDPPAGQISGAYTVAGREAIWHVVSILKQAYQGYQTPTIQASEKKFKAQYDLNYLNHWRNWIKEFLKVSSVVPSALFLEYEGRFSRDNSPYSQVFELLNQNLRPYFGANAEDWLKNIELDGAIINWKGFEDSVETFSKRERLAIYSLELESIKTSMPDLFNRKDLLERIMNAQPFVRRYQIQSSIIESLLKGPPDEAMKLAASHFGGADLDILEQSPFNQAELALKAYAKQMYATSDGSEGLVTSLRLAALDYVKNLLVAMVAKRVDELWLSEVVEPTRFLSVEDTNKALYGQDGLIRKFQKTTAAPFLVDSGEKGYQAAIWDKKVFPFTDDFLRILNAGNQFFIREPIQDSYNVTISAVASLVPETALEKPQRTTLTLKSPDSIQTLDIFNYPISKVFSWKPGQIGDVELAIILPSLELYLTYNGSNAFAGLLTDILKGDLVFTPSDFPERQEKLKALGITELKVLIKADGAIPVIRFMDLNPLPLPRSIVKLS
ncbi:MAG: hypothetical protein LBT86_08280 [Deltaproteobacteria bacterium]|nr:hypothetical protein [Deltaproteobacteria bacterium]